MLLEAVAQAKQKSAAGEDLHSYKRVTNIVGKCSLIRLPKMMISSSLYTTSSPKMHVRGGAAQGLGFLDLKI